MVRRRATKAAAVTGGGAPSENHNLLENVELKSTVGCTHLEEQYFASPKRKDCKIDNCSTEMLSGREQKIEKEAKTHGKTKSSSSSSGAGKAKSERGGIAGRTIVANPEEISSYEDLSHYKQIDQPPTPDTPCDIDDDSNDSEYSEKLTHQTVFGSDFLTHRSQLRDSHSSTGSACTNISNTENIFLQEPVLTLNVDKTSNQATSIKINTSLGVEPVFSSPPALTSVLNGRFNQIVSLNISQCKRDPFLCEKQNMAAVAVHDDLVEGLLPEQENDNDNSSCDSGVAFTTTNTDKMGPVQNDKIELVTSAEHTRRRKPATPHRIVCPSPIKTMPPMISPIRAAITNDRILSPSGRKLQKEPLSPRKSPRQMTSVHTKTRRRLNPQKEFGAFNNAEEVAKLLTDECAEAMVSVSLMFLAKIVNVLPDFLYIT
ncbi:unnamed protein product [Ceratitis capitata]|uniref:(Mediterranean fruit fly) hypothetical protein n=1 Tax=Ceratitis capitata TaxID=7213 RepID=A0A811U4C0_CERCA|nr:unnamed protein product [Ceratitis capitata]